MFFYSFESMPYLQIFFIKGTLRLRVVLGVKGCLVVPGFDLEPSDSQADVIPP